MHRFLCLNEPFKVGSEVTLPREQSHHLAKVLRMSEGDRILLMDGKGAVATAKITLLSDKAARAQVEALEVASQRSKVHLVFSIPKPAAADFILHRLTEVGVQSFQPLITQHASFGSQWNQERWEKVVREVIKQCQDPFVPVLHPPVKLETWLGERDRSRLLMLCDEADRFAGGPSHTTLPEVEVLVGAEGGWSRSEVEAILAAGAQKLSLGSNRLRAETAALVAVILIKQWLKEI